MSKRGGGGRLFFTQIFQKTRPMKPVNFNWSLNKNYLGPLLHCLSPTTALEPCITLVDNLIWIISVGGSYNRHIFWTTILILGLICSIIPKYLCVVRTWGTLLVIGDILIGDVPNKILAQFSVCRLVRYEQTILWCVLTVWAESLRLTVSNFTMVLVSKNSLGIWEKTKEIE